MNYFPFGFRYPDGLAHNAANPDPGIETIRHRMDYLNRLHDLSGMPGHTFAAAMALFQTSSLLEPGAFWENIQNTLTDNEVVAVAKALLPKVQNEPPRLEFPNSIALFDCRFVSTKEWEHIRRYSIGGSEASTVLGKSHFQSQRTLYHEKKTPYSDEKDIGLQHILDYGHAVEDYVISHAAQQLGAVPYPEYRMWAHKEYPFITCNPDGILLFADGHLSLFEAKTAFWLKYDEWKDGIPEYYEPQPRQYLGVLDDPRLSDGYIGVCFGGGERDFLMHHYTRDKQIEDAQMQSVADYWNKYIVTSTIPEFSGNSSLDLTAEYKYCEHNINTNTVDTLSADLLPSFQEYAELSAKCAALNKEIRQYKEEENRLMSEIKPNMPDGVTVVKSGNEMPFIIKVKDSKRETVNSNTLIAKSMSATDFLGSLAQKLNGKSLGFSIPKIKIQKLKGTKK